MLKFNTVKKSLFGFLTIVALSCNISDLDFDNIEGPTLDGEMALPIGHAHYTIRELLDKIEDKELELLEDSISLLHLIYRDTAEFGAGNEIINFDNIINSAQIQLPETPPSPGSQVIPVNMEFTFSYPADKSEEINSIFYKTGTLTLNLNSGLTYDITYQLTIQDTRHETTDVPVTFTGSLAANSTASDSLELADYKTELLLQNGLNTFNVEISMNILLDAGESINAGDAVTFELAYKKQAFDLLYGKFGQDTLQIGDTMLDMKFFANLGAGMEFGSPQITFNFLSSFGLPLGIFFDGLYGVSGSDQFADTIYLRGPITSAHQTLQGAAQPGESINTTIALNNSNSTIQDLLAQSPNTLGFNLKALSNPDDLLAQNFVLDSSKINTVIEMLMPLEVSLNDLTREIGFKLGDGLEFDDADSIAIRIVSENGLPFNASLQLYIEGEGDTVLYTVADKLVLETPFIDQNGIVTQSRKFVSDIPISKEGINALNQGTRMVLILTLNTPQNTGNNKAYIKVLADYAIDLKVAAFGKFNYKPW